MTLFELSPQDRLNYNGQIYKHFSDVKDVSSDKIDCRIYKRYHDNKRAYFKDDVEVEFMGSEHLYPIAADNRRINYYKLKDIQ